MYKQACKLPLSCLYKDIISSKPKTISIGEILNYLDEIFEEVRLNKQIANDCLVSLRTISTCLENKVVLRLA